MPSINESLLRCPGCQAKNRVPRERVRQGPTCSRCHLPLLPAAPVTVTDRNWPVEVDASPLPVLVDFWAPWCGPCRTMAPVLEQLASETVGRLKIAKVNVDDNPQAAARFGVQAIPTLVLLDRGETREEIRGAVGKAALRARIDRHLL